MACFFEFSTNEFEFSHIYGPTQRIIVVLISELMCKFSVGRIERRRGTASIDRYWNIKFN